MSRSVRKSPFIKIAGNSDKLDRSKANRKFRRISKVKIAKDEIPPENLKEVSNTWSFSSDGLACRLKCAFSHSEEDKKNAKRFMRK